VGRSVEGRPIEAVERGTPGGRVVLVIGVIHGDEPAGLAVVDRLEAAPIPAGIDLWLVPSMNPDGQAAHRRTNAHLVDLNRNFPRRWAPLDQPGQPEYAGPAPASEPETRSIVALISLLRPQLVIWYHQDLNRIAPASGQAGQVRRQYAALTGLPVLPVTGGTYTGTASTWAQANVRDSISFIVELGPTLSPAQADRHAAAVLRVANG
jgi:protein MpaA